MQRVLPPRLPDDISAYLRHFYASFTQNYVKLCYYSHNMKNQVSSPTGFYNRTAQTRRALNLLRKGQSVSVIGPPGIGKTAFLRHLTAAVKQVGACLGTYSDGATMTSLPADKIYHRLSHSIQNAVEMGSPDTAHPTPPYKALQRTVRQLTNQGLTVAVCIDNFDRLVAGAALNDDFFSGLRALAMRFDATFVTASCEPLAKLAGRTPSPPFLSLFLPLTLGLLNEAESRVVLAGMVGQMGHDLVPAVADWVIALSGGHPLLLQKVARCAIDGRLAQKPSLSHKEKSALVQQVLPRLQEHFARSWRRLNEEQRCVLVYLPQLGYDRRLERVIQELAALCLVVKRNRGYAHYSPLFEEFVRQQSVSAVRNLGLISVCSA